MKDTGTLIFSSVFDTAQADVKQQKTGEFTHQKKNRSVVWLPFFIFPYIGLLSSSQLTNSNLFQRGGPTTKESYACSKKIHGLIGFDDEGLTMGEYRVVMGKFSN